jgi:tRNA(Ile)-lysidine synthase
LFNVKLSRTAMEAEYVTTEPNGSNRYEIIDEVEKSINRYSMIQEGESIILGVSGGPDSMTMLHIMSRLKEKYNLSLITVTVNHNLRGGEAVVDAETVKTFSEKMNIPCFIESANVSGYAHTTGQSLQMAGREIRYSLYLKYAEKYGAKRIALGHNADDVVETVLLNLTRGTGAEGLEGIRPSIAFTPGGPSVIRPLIEINRGKIEKYCMGWNIPTRIDPSNKKNIYLRNRIRNELLPLLENKYNPAVRDAITRLAKTMRDENDLLDEISENEYRSMAVEEGPYIKIPIYALLGKHIAIQRRILRMAISTKHRVPAFAQVEKVREMAHSEGGTQIELGGGLLARKFQGNIEISYDKTFTKAETPAWTGTLTVPGACTLPDGSIIKAEKLESPAYMFKDARPWEAYLDASQTGSVLKVRYRSPGDRFLPLGLGACKKVKDFLIDSKVDPRERDRIPIVESMNGICWVAGLRIDENHRVTERTADVVKLTLVRDMAVSHDVEGL